MKTKMLMAALTMAAVAWAGPARADDDKDKDKGKGQGTQTVIIANTPVPVTVTNASVPVTVSSLPGVTVTNTPGVVVTNTPSVNVTSLPNVTLAPNTQVIVGNTHSAPIPVVSLDANGAFQVQLTLQLSGGNLPFQAVSIPAGKRLVVEFVTLSGAAASAGGPIQPIVLLESALNTGGAANYYLKPDPSSLTPEQFYRSEPVKVYADTLAVGLGYAGFAPLFLGFNVAISGHLVDLP